LNEIHLTLQLRLEVLMVVPTSHMWCQTVWYAVIYILVGCWYLLTNHVATIARIFKDCRLLGYEVKQYGMQLSTFGGTMVPSYKPMWQQRPEDWNLLIQTRLGWRTPNVFIKMLHLWLV